MEAMLTEARAERLAATDYVDVQISLDEVDALTNAPSAACPSTSEGRSGHRASLGPWPVRSGKQDIRDPWTGYPMALLVLLRGASIRSGRGTFVLVRMYSNETRPGKGHSVDEASVASAQPNTELDV